MSVCNFVCEIQDYWAAYAAKKIQKLKTLEIAEKLLKKNILFLNISSQDLVFAGVANLQAVSV